MMVLVVLVAAGGLAVLLFHLLGWKGLLAFPFLVLALVWIGKVLVSKLIKHFALGLFAMKSRTLRGATMKVHSITAVPKPPEAEADDSEDEEAEPSDEDEGEQQQAERDQSGEAGEEQAEEEDEEEEPEEPRVYYEVDVTITPGAEARAGFWEPGELMLTSGPVTSLDDLEEKEAGTTHGLLVWDGSKFGDDDAGKYPGEQRLKITFAVKPGVSKAWLQYYNETIGELSLPVGSGVGSRAGS
jgi:hypothetical protein